MTMTGNDHGLWCVKYHPNGKQLASASPEGVCKLWDLKSGKATDVLKAHTKKAYYIAYDDTGNYLTSCGSDRMLYQWDARKTKSPIGQNRGNPQFFSIFYR